MDTSRLPTVQLKPDREKSVLARHPWIYSGAVSQVKGNPGVGATVDVYSSAGVWLCRGAYSPESNIRVRAWTWNPAQHVDAAFFRSAIDRAVAARTVLGLNTIDMVRLINAESDGLPGVVLDRYNDVLVLQLLTAGADLARAEITAVLAEMGGATCIYERSDVDVRTLEGLPERTGLLWGALPAQPLECRENGLHFQVDCVTGHKTGFYLDQRANRRLFGTLTAGRDVLNCFSYSGAFGVYALANGARSVTSVDSSAAALALSRANLVLNGLQGKQHEEIDGDAFHVLRTFRDQGRRFDAIVLDPPKFAPTAAQAQRAARGYKDINLLAFKLLRPGGLLFTFSCSGGVPMDLFQKIVASAAQDAGVQSAILLRMFQDADHPVRLNFPEGSYLKGLVCRLED